MPTDEELGIRPCPKCYGKGLDISLHEGYKKMSEAKKAGRSPAICHWCTGTGKWFSRVSNEKKIIVPVDLYKEDKNSDFTAEETMASEIVKSKGRGRPKRDKEKSARV